MGFASHPSSQDLEVGIDGFCGAAGHGRGHHIRILSPPPEPRGARSKSTRPNHSLHLHPSRAGLLVGRHGAGPPRRLTAKGQEGVVGFDQALLSDDRQGAVGRLERMWNRTDVFRLTGFCGPCSLSESHIAERPCGGPAPFYSCATPGCDPPRSIRPGVPPSDALPPPSARRRGRGRALHSAATIGWRSGSPRPC
jgi:hypothetical protein